MRTYVTTMAAVLTVLFATAQNDCGIENNSFKAGEKFSLEIGYKFGLFKAKAGIADFTIKDAVWDNKPTYHITGEGKTYHSYDWFYKVHDVYESYLDKETLLPVKFIRDVNEGGYTINNEYTFDHGNELVNIDKNVIQGKDKKKADTMPINACSQDILSAIYIARTVDYSAMQVGDVRNVKVFLDGKEWDIGIKYLGKETLKTKIGKVRCVKFQPTLLEGTIFDANDEMIVYASDDENKLPILIEAGIAVGKIRAYIVRYDNLKHEFTAKV